MVEQMDLNSARYFVAVVQEKSFTAAGKRLGIPKSTVSERVRDLEQALGVTLLNRTTRKLALTEAGEQFFLAAQEAVNLLETAKEGVSTAQQKPTGRLRITAVTDPSMLVILEAVSEYRKRYPDVEVEVDYTDRVVDILGEGYDIAVRGGDLDDSSLMVKRLGSTPRVLVASDRYLKSAPSIRSPKDLAAHPVIGFIADYGDHFWTLRNSEGKKLKLTPTKGVATSTFTAIKALVALHQGLALVPKSLCNAELKSGRFVQVLPDWKSPEAPVSLVYLPQRFSAPKVKAMIPLLEEKLRKLLE